MSRLLCLLLIVTGTVMASPTLPPELHDDVHGVKMGVVHEDCDDAKSRLDIDWDGSEVNYTCLNPRNPLQPTQVQPVQSCVQQTDPAIHICTTEPITYNDSIPTSGAHRPLWPVFGEYKFVPLQRWIHSMEHGAVVMLYDPCTHPSLVDKLRKLVTSCIRKHIITPFQNLPADRPLALVSWGCKILMSHVDEQQVVKFIKEHGMHGTENEVSRDGDYSLALLKKAQVPFGSTYEDDNLCPAYP